jgi:predicted Zn-dependent protease
MDRRTSWPWLFALWIMLPGCQKESVIHAPATIRVLTDEMVPSGSTRPPAESRPGRLRSDAALLESVIRVSSRLIAAARGMEYGSQADTRCWTIAVYDNTAPSRTFVTPDGVIIVSSGSFSLAQTEAGLAALLSHELIHALVHGTASVSPPCSGDTTEPSRALFTYEEELQADELGLKLMAEAGYDPRDWLRLWERMKQQTDGINDDVLVHLTYDRRMDRMTQAWKDAMLRYQRANRAPQKMLPPQ